MSLTVGLARLLRFCRFTRTPSQNAFFELRSSFNEVHKLQDIVSEVRSSNVATMDSLCSMTIRIGENGKECTGEGKNKTPFRVTSK